jgi:hypothetical protein
MMNTHESHDPGTQQGDPAAGHGMLIVGEQTVFLSHLPMFMSPHNYQVILEATFTNQGSNPQAVYVEDRKKNPKEKIYTFAPKPFVLPDLFPPDSNRPPRLREFKGDLFRGHFERFPPRVPKAPARIDTDVVVNVTNVVYFQKFDPKVKDLDPLEYLLFGKGQELFLAHLITKPPDFDQIMSIKAVGHQFTDEELRRGIPIKFPGRANFSKEKIKEGEKVPGVIQVASKDVPLKIEAIGEFYFEEDELRK